MLKIVNITVEQNLLVLLPIRKREKGSIMQESRYTLLSYDIELLKPKEGISTSQVKPNLSRLGIARRCNIYYGLARITL